VVGAEEFDWLSAEAFQMFAPGIVISEGAGALYLEAARPGADAARLTAILGPELYTTRRGKSEAVRQLAAALATQQGQAADQTLLDRRNGDPACDAAEDAAWEGFPGQRISPASILGESQGAAVAWQCVVAAGMAARGERGAVVCAAGENEAAAVAVFGPISDLPL
jgi:hypothetical protein